MPLPFDRKSSLRVSLSEFNKDGLFALMVHGNRYGGNWNINLFPADERPADNSRGSIMTSWDHKSDDLTKDDNFPDLALDTAYVWLNSEASALGWRLVYWSSLKDQIPKDQQPFLILAQAVIGNEHFTPMKDA
ncbi:hypothetical protein [Amycolatopsis sp. WGS_07]|uniref:hypothetical protein n=1 Tax=Amycolatopsis sp. WGS_07 TaxID=3076764 RepID=UPI0038739C5B